MNNLPGTLFSNRYAIAEARPSDIGNPLLRIKIYRGPCSRETMWIILRTDLERTGLRAHRIRSRRIRSNRLD